MTMMIDDDDGDDDDDADDDDDDDDDDKGHQFMMSTRISEFLTPSVHMRPLVDIHVPSTWNTHNPLEMASTMTFRT